MAARLRHPGAVNCRIAFGICDDAVVFQVSHNARRAASRSNGDSLIAFEVIQEAALNRSRRLGAWLPCFRREVAANAGMKDPGVDDRQRQSAPRRRGNQEPLPSEKALGGTTSRSIALRSAGDTVTDAGWPA